MPRSDSRVSKPTLSTKSRRTGSCRSFFQSSLIAPGMCPLSYALVSSSTSTSTTPGSPECASTQSASTRTSERLMQKNLLGRSGRCFPLRRRPDPADEQVHLVAQAEAEGRVDERGSQGHGGERHAEGSEARGVADHPDHGDDHADTLREPGPRRRLHPPG